MVAINLGDSLKKEKGIAEPQLPPDKTISEAPELQFEEKCSKNGRVIFRWTILTQVVTLGLFIHLIYSLWTFHYCRRIIGLSFLLVGGLLFGSANTLAYQGYYKTKGAYVRLQYLVLGLLLLTNIPIVLLIWTVTFDELMESHLAPFTMFGLSLLIPLQFYCAVVWRQIEKKMISGEGHQDIEFFDQAMKWALELFEEIWACESRTVIRTSTRLQHHQQAIRNAVFLLALTFTTELTTYGFFIVWINSVHVGYIGCHRTYLTLLLTSVFAILFTVTNVPALCAYFRTKKTRHATLKYKCFKATALWSASCVLALFTYLAIYFHSIYPTVLSVLMSFQFYCEFTWWRIQERMRQGKDHRMISIFDPIFNCGTIVREVCPDEPGSEVKEEVEGGIQPNVIA